ncbi:GGDEF domain-containing protein [Nocardioides sp.]|uniref:GGDEF domain-containing protein n=1 Tax=Nocardioides sp. TaxID=35761 RepID=UPI0035AEA83B
MIDRAVLEPRDPKTATTFAVTLCVVGGGLSAAVTAFAPQDVDPGMKAPVLMISFAVMLAGLLLVVVKEQLRVWLWLPVPLLGIVSIVLADLATNDASAAGQVILCAPVLFAASQLRAPAAWLVTCCAVAADAAIVLALSPPERALPDLASVGVLLVITTWLLVRAGERTTRLTDKLREQAAIDPLTGLVTRRVLDDAARSVLTSSDGDGGTSLILLDVDRFKQINDTWGHPAGDAALTHLAEVLRAHSRPETVLSRLGGDEMAMLLPGCPYDTALRRAWELVEAVRTSPLTLAHGEQVTLSISVGVAHAPVHADTLQGLYTTADLSLYDAKRTGRGRVGRVPDTVEGTDARA